MPASIRLALVASCVLLAACDSADPDVPEVPAIVGTWTSQTYGSETYATLSQSQVAFDPFSPAVGEVRMEGAQSAVLRYVVSREVNRDFGETVVSYTISSASRLSTGTPFIELTGSPRFAVVDVHDGRRAGSGEDLRSYIARAPDTAPPVTQSGDTLRIGPNVYHEYPNTGASVTVQGTLVVPRRRIDAGVETRMRQAASFIGDDAITLTIRADGTVSERGQNSAPLSGTWSVGSDSTVTFIFGGSGTDTRYRITGSTLRLESVNQGGCEAMCRSRIEDAADLLPGTVRSARRAYNTTYTRERP